MSPHSGRREPKGLFGRGQRLAWLSEIGYTALWIAPSIALLWYIAHFGVDVPFWDEWDFLPTIRQAFNGRNVLPDLYALYAEQRPLLPRLVILANAFVTRYNAVGVMLVSGALVSITSLLLLWRVRTSGALAGHARWLLLAVPFLLAGFRQWEGVLWAWQVQRYLSACFMLVSLLGLTSDHFRWRWIVLSLSSGLLASFSTADGLLVWPLGVCVLAVAWSASAGQRRELRWAVAMWAVLGIGVWGLYFRGLRESAEHPRWLSFLDEPDEALRYLLMAVGSPLAVERETATACGVLLLLLAGVALAAWLRSDAASRWRDCLAVSLIVYSGGTLALLVLGRYGLGPEQALSSRYVITTSLGIVGLVLFAASRAQAGHAGWFAATAMLVGIALMGVIAGAQHGMWQAQALHQTRERQAYYLETYEVQPPETLHLLGPDPELVQRSARFLSDNRLSVFRSGPTVMSSAAAATDDAYALVESVNGRVGPSSSGVRISAASEPVITVVGWAADKQANRPSSAVYVEVDERLRIPAMVGISRPDIAAELASEALRDSGFEAQFGTAKVGRGLHELRLIVVDVDERAARATRFPVRLEIQ